MSADAVEGKPKLALNVWRVALPILLTVGLAVVISVSFGRQPLLDVLSEGKPWPVQAACGIVIGLLVTVPAGVLINRVSSLDPLRRQLVDIVSRADLSGFNPLWFSLCAGIGEEMLFRGALQPLLGIGLTSVIFTALHARTGGFQSMNRMKAVYALIVLLISMLLGTVFTQIGLIAAIIMHIVIDLIALTNLRTPRGHER